MLTALDVASYIKSSLGPLDSYKLQKLVYFTQAWHLAWTGRPVFNEPFEAWPKGPVVRSVYRENRYGIIPTVGGLDEETRSILDAVIDYYGEFNSEKLVALTHADAPWIEARKGLGPGESSQRELNEKTMLDFYTAQALAEENGPTRKACVADAASPVVSVAAADVISRWREGLDLLATK
jgi:uncharacterized phage-associated protein